MTRRRVLALLRARLRSQGGDAIFPAATVAQHLMASAVLCGLVRGAVPPYAYAVCALAASAALVAIPLLGELGYLLRADPAAAWVGSLPARAVELRAARTLHLLSGLGVLVLAALVPAALLAPPGSSIALRLALPLEGLAQAAALAAALLGAQALLGGRLEALLVLAQTAVVVLVVVGLVAGAGAARSLAGVEAPVGAPWLAWFPPAWFAAPHAAGAGAVASLLPALLGAAALSVLALGPSPSAVVPGRRRRSPLELLLAPARALAARAWLRSDERGPFDLVYDGLPREREVVLRTVPMIGIPLAFLLLGARGGEPETSAELWKREGLLALILLTPGIYLPILLAQVSVTSTPRAAHLLATAPVSPAAVANGALKALAVRYLLPLYLVLGAIAWNEMGFAFTVRLALPGALLSLVVMRLLWQRVVLDPPLSRAPDDVRTEYDLAGVLMAVAVALAVLAAFASKLVSSVPIGLACAGALLGLDLALERASRRRR